MTLNLLPDIARSSYHHGEPLIGCVECNGQSWRGSKRLFVELPGDDLEALKNVLPDEFDSA